MSIALSAATVQQFLVGGVALETNGDAALISTSLDFNSNTMTWTFTTGTRANGSLNPGPHGMTTSIVLNLTTGVWTNTQTGATGTVQNGAGGPLTILNNGLKNLRNGIENAAIVQSIYDGVQVPW